MRQIIQLLWIFLPLTLMAQKATVEQLFNVQTIKVKKESLSHTKKNYGFVKADDARVYEVTPRFSGYVEKLYADKIYKYVKKGEPLVVVYSPEVYKAKEDYLNSYYYTKNKQNRGMFQSAKLKLELLGISDAEIKEILQHKKVSQSTTIYAPQSGYIFKKNINKGSAFNAKTSLFEIVNLDEVWVEVKLFEDDISWLKGVKDFYVTFKSTPTHYFASSSLLYPKLDPKVAMLTLRVRLKNKKQELFPGMYASVISKDATQTYLTLPTNAVLRKDGKYYVFIVSDFKGEYEPIEVDVQALTAHTYIIKSGLKVGDEVVSNALFMMDSDAQINGLY